MHFVCPRHVQKHARKRGVHVLSGEHRGRVCRLHLADGLPMQRWVLRPGRRPVYRVPGELGRRGHAPNRRGLLLQRRLLRPRRRRVHRVCPREQRVFVHRSILRVRNRDVFQRGYRRLCVCAIERHQLRCNLRRSRQPSRQWRLQVGHRWNRGRCHHFDVLCGSNGRRHAAHQSMHDVRM